MTTITNDAGTKIDFDAAVNLMDNGIREGLQGEMSGCTEAEFFAAYCTKHRDRYGEEFEANKQNPVW